MGDRGRWGPMVGAAAGWVLALLLLYELRGLLFLILVAFVLAYVLDPAVTRIAGILGGVRAPSPGWRCCSCYS